MSIWHERPYLDRLNNPPTQHMGTFLGIEFIRIGDDELVARMPVNERTRQPYGIIHGGASVVLAETVGSVASHYAIDSDVFIAFGMEVNANHVRPARDGYVTAVCKPLHLGRSTHVWDIRITDDSGKLTCVSRLTVAIVERNKVN